MQHVPVGIQDRLFAKEHVGEILGDLLSEQDIQAALCLRRCLENKRGRRGREVCH